MIFLTGASGFLGRSLIDKFSKSDAKVCCLSRYEKQSYNNNIIWHQADLTALPLCDDLLKGCSVVVHAAAAIKGSIPHLNKLNYYATKELIIIAKKSKVKKFVFISSLDAILSQSVYAISKRNAEEILKNSGLNWIIIRPSQIFGINDTKNFTILNKVIKKSPVIPLPHKGLFRWEPVFVDDLAEYIVKCTTDDAISNKCFNVVGPEMLSFGEIVNQLEKHNNTYRIKIVISSSVVAFLKKIASVVLGTHKSDEIFSSFKSKIALEHHGEKIRLPTKLSQVYP